MRAIIAGVLGVLLATASASGGDVLTEVDPFIGVDGNGNVFPGACLPFSMMRLSPDTLPPQVTSGYSSDKPIVGFSHTHTSGTGGGGRYGNFLVTPQSGAIDLADTTSAKSNEQASPGYYAVTLDRWNVRAELTVTPRCGVHRYTFANAGDNAIVFNVAAARVTNPAKPTNSSICTNASAEVVSDRRIEGWATVQGGWGNAHPNTTWFVAEFDEPFASVEFWRDGEIQAPGTTKTGGNRSGFVARYKTAAGEAIGLRVGISFVSLENARRNLSQSDGMSFDEVRQQAEANWREHLNRIKVEGGTPEQRRCFYTALYRAVVMPTDVTGENPRWSNDGPHFWDFYAIWDTFRCTNSLWTLIIPDEHVRMIRCLLDIYRHEGWLPDAWIAGHLSYVQGGTNADMVIGEAVVKGLQGFDLQTAYEAVKKDATDATGNGHTFGRYREYFTNGYLPVFMEDGRPFHLASSRTLEYAANDFAVSQVAQALDRSDEADHFRQQSLNAFKLFNPETKFFWAKDAQGKWLDGFIPNKEANPPGHRPFYEGTPWQYAFYVPHDMQGLINRHGGPAAFEKFLDEAFDTNQYDATNEPDLLVPWLYTYINRPAKNVDRVRDILARRYNTGRKGLPGNDDSGTMSAWYLFGAMGFYPVAAQDVYLLASPVFSQVQLSLGNGRMLVIDARGLTEANRYIQSATLNGKPLAQGWFRHADIAQGAELILEMGPQPSAWGTAGPPPPSISEPQPTP